MAYKKKVYEKCGAKNRNNGLCNHPAGWGTDHLGTGRCKYHGGKTPKGQKNALKHGAYENMAIKRLVKKSVDGELVPDVPEQEHFKQIPVDLQLKTELQILRYKLLRLLSPVEQQVAMPVGEEIQIARIDVDEVTKAKAIARLAAEIRKVVKDMGNEGGEEALSALTAALAASAAALARQRIEEDDDDEDPDY